jgi:lysophospholipase L1-like esterase
MRSRLILAVFALAMPLLVAELFAQAVTRLGWIELPRPMTTLVPQGTEDWRLAHITADRYREADPVLLWRPVARAPYNSQRMKGPVALTPKPAGVFRIMVYGDSNADGPATGSWPELLSEALAGDGRAGSSAFEVLNAGVTGYSSYQGALRLEAQITKYAPDLVLAAFGWNDAADALGEPDRLFEPPPPWLAALQRGLLRLRSYRLLRALSANETSPDEVGTRVPLEDFDANLARMADLCRAHGATFVVLTRATLATPAALELLTPGWRSRVPAYNEAARRFAATHGIELLDTNEHFLASPLSSDAFVDECHFSSVGRRRMAQWVADTLSERGLLPGRAAGPER